MKRTRWFGLRTLIATVLFGAGIVLAAGIADAQQPPGPRGAPEPPMLGIHWARGENPGQGHGHGPGGGGGNSSPDLQYHGGPVMNGGTVVQPIFWGSCWTAGNYKISGMNSFYAGAGNTTYMGTNTEYTDSAGHVSPAVSSVAALIDTSAAPRHAPRTSDVLAEVAKEITNPVADGYYPVYVDTPRGGAGYCAWHSWGSINGVPVQFGFVFNLDGDAGCDPQDTWTNNPQGLAAIANVSGHELSEVATDPQGSAWYDAAGSENADKCAWTFNAPITFSNQTEWKIQGNWSNAAYDNGQSGYANGGCIDGN